MGPYCFSYFSSPLGLLKLCASDQGLHEVDFQTQPGDAPTPPAAVPASLRDAHRQLAAYFGRELREFSLDCRPSSGTDFQRQVWQALPAVAGYGRTASYLALARQLGRPQAVRAVGAANGRNPLLIVLPCHRIVGADGSLTGYAGGLARKQWLLAFEQPARQMGLFG